VCVGVEVRVIVLVAVGVYVAVGLGVAVGVVVRVGVLLGVTVAVGVGVWDGVAVGVVLAVPVDVRVVVAVGLGVAVGVAVRGGVLLGVTVGVGERVGVRVGINVGVGVVVGLAVGVLDGVAVGVLVGVLVGGVAAKSQASPTPLPSLSRWSTLGTWGQLSNGSAISSPSESRAVATSKLFSQVAPCGQSLVVTHGPCPFRQWLASQNWPLAQSPSCVHAVARTSTQRPALVKTSPRPPVSANGAARR
jgi:hypothetical protein